MVRIMDDKIQYPPTPERFEMGDNRMFHSREGDKTRYGDPTWQVYSIGLEPWATCNSPEKSKTVRDALEAFYSNVEMDNGE